jgi:hypothetical protein
MYESGKGVPQDFAQAEREQAFSWIARGDGRAW